MAMTPEQRGRLEEMLDKMSKEEVDTVLETIDTFTHWIYYKCRDTYYAIKNAIKAVWQKIKEIFS